MSAGIRFDPQAFDLETESVRLRPLTELDEELYCSLYTSADTMRFIGDVLTPGAAASSFRCALLACRKPDWVAVYLAIRDRSTGAALGICALAQIDFGRRCAEAGIMLRPEARSRGYASQALGALLAASFASLPIDEIWVEFSARDPAVERLNIRLGFKPRIAAAADENSGPKRIWSVQRAANGSSAATNNRREVHVERHQAS